MTHDEEEDESAWLGGSLRPREEEVKGEIDKMLKRISGLTGIEEEELKKRNVKAMEEKPDYDPDFDDEPEEEEEDELDLPETKEEAARELSALEKELAEKRRRLEMTPSERREEDERIKREREEEYKKRSGAKTPPPGTGTPIPTPTVISKVKLGECCKRMSKELLEKTNVAPWQDHKGNKIIAFSHTYLKLLHCPWCGAKLE